MPLQRANKAFKTAMLHSMYGRPDGKAPRTCPKGYARTGARRQGQAARTSFGLPSTDPGALAGGRFWHEEHDRSIDALVGILPLDQLGCLLNAGNDRHGAQ